MALPLPEAISDPHDLGMLWRNRYRKTGLEADLDMAIRYHQEAVTLTSLDDPRDRAFHLHNLGAVIHEKYHKTRLVKYLDRTIQLFGEVLDLDPNSPDRTSYIYGLATGYRARYNHLGTEADLNQAIQMFQEALGMTPSNHPHRHHHLFGLGSAYGDRYRRYGAIADLDKAIELFQESLPLIASDSPDQGSRLHNLGTAHHDRYQRTRSEADFAKAIEFLQSALDLDPTSRYSHTHSLGVAYRDKYINEGTVEDLDRAISLHEQSVAAAPANVAFAIYTLGVDYKYKYQNSKELSKLDRALQLFRDALSMTPSNHPNWATYSHSLGLAYHEKYRKAQASMFLDQAIQSLQNSLNHTNSLVHDRLLAGKDLLPVIAESKTWQQAYQAACVAVHLVPLLTPRFLETSDKQNLLSQITGLASDAAASALGAKRAPSDAIRLLELGRGVIATSLHEMRVEISELLEINPELGEKFLAFRNQLNTHTISPSPHDHSGAWQSSANLRHHTHNELEQLMVDIRSRPGLEEFLGGPSERELQLAARKGPIVVLNVSEYRCDAILIEQCQIRPLPLSFTGKEIARKARNGYLGGFKVLEWLWDVLAGPVLNALGFANPPSEGHWPHVWWIPTGALTKFPIHAAGYHLTGGSNTVLDRVMSSYSSSIADIIHARKRRPLDTPSVPHRQALLVAMKHTPECDWLDFAEDEVAMLHDLCQSMTLLPVEPGREKRDIMSHLPNCDIFHFAGHGFTNESDPLKSSLLLQDWQSNSLTVADLLQLNLRDHPRPFLAYLSACGTSQIGEDKFVDESIHLIRACQLAGFRHVIGTLWEVNDDSCVDMARITYETMRDAKMTDDSVCLGLHRSIRASRKKWRETRSTDRGRKHKVHDTDSEDEEHENLHWVPYVHFGV